MGISTLYTLGAVVASGSPSFSLHGIRQAAISTEIQQVIERAGGQVDPTHVSVVRQMPMARFTTTQIATALGGAGISGLGVDSGGTTSLDLYFAKYLKRNTRSSSSDHGRVRIVDGLLVPRVLTVPDGGTATLTYEAFAIYDGTNAPLQFAFNVAYPASAAISQLFTMGKFTISGATVAGCKQWELDFGLEIVNDGSCGESYPTFVGINNRGPTITLRTLEAPDLATYGLSGTAQGSTDSVFYLRKFEKNAGLLAAATAEHISFTMDDGQITIEELGGENNQPSELGIRLTPTFDGTNAILVINTATAIS
jgi:hypothetical protein